MSPPGPRRLTSGQRHTALEVTHHLARAALPATLRVLGKYSVVKTKGGGVGVVCAPLPEADKHVGTIVVLSVVPLLSKALWAVHAMDEEMATLLAYGRALCAHRGLCAKHVSACGDGWLTAHISPLLRLEQTPQTPLETQEDALDRRINKTLSPNPTRAEVRRLMCSYALDAPSASMYIDMIRSFFRVLARREGSGASAPSPTTPSTPNDGANGANGSDDSNHRHGGTELPSRTVAWTLANPSPLLLPSLATHPPKAASVIQKWRRCRNEECQRMVPSLLENGQQHSAALARRLARELLTDAAQPSTITNYWSLLLQDGFRCNPLDEEPVTMPAQHVFCSPCCRQQWRQQAWASLPLKPCDLACQAADGLQGAYDRNRRVRERRCTGPLSETRTMQEIGDAVTHALNVDVAMWLVCATLGPRLSASCGVLRPASIIIKGSKQEYSASMSYSAVVRQWGSLVHGVGLVHGKYPLYRPVGAEWRQHPPEFMARVRRKALKMATG